MFVFHFVNSQNFSFNDVHYSPTYIIHFKCVDKNLANNHPKRDLFLNTYREFVSFLFFSHSSCKITIQKRNRIELCAKTKTCRLHFSLYIFFVSDVFALFIRSFFCMKPPVQQQQQQQQKALCFH